MPDGDVVDPLQKHDVHEADRRTHDLLGQVLARLPGSDECSDALLRAIAPVVRDDASRSGRRRKCIPPELDFKEQPTKI